MDSLPATWARAALSELTKSMGGGTPDTRDPRFWVDGSIPWVSPKDMKTFEIGQSIDSVSADALARLTLVPRESVLIVVRSGILSRVLPVAVNTVPVTINQDMRAFVPHAGVDARFLAWQLVSRGNAILAACAKDGTTVASIEGSRLASFEIALAPEAQQQRIVDLIEELTSDLDAGVAELKAAQAKLNQYRQSLLKAAVEGALTAEWRERNPPQETGAELLARILRERQGRWESHQISRFEAAGSKPPARWQVRYPKPLELDELDLPPLPASWTWATLDALIDDGPQNGLYLPADRYGVGCPILRIDDFQIGRPPLRESLRLVQADAEAVESYALCNDDIVINRVNSMTHLGKSICVPAQLAGAVYESNMMRIRLHPLIHPNFVAAYLGSAIGRGRLTSRAKWAVNQASINQQDVRRTPVPLPPAAEQAAIFDMLSMQLDGADAQVRAIEQGVLLAAAQRQNILRAAFSGQLVPQGPAGEPASALLARIRAERAQRPAAAKRMRRSPPQPATP